MFVFLLVAGLFGISIKDHFQAKTYGDNHPEPRKNYRALSVDLLTDRIFAVKDDERGIDVIDASTRNIITTVLAGHEIKGIAIDEQRRLIAASDEDKVVRVLSADTLNEITSIPIKEEPAGISIDSDLGIMLVTAEDGEVAAIDLTTSQIIKEIKVLDKPRAVSIDRGLHLAVIAHHTWGSDNAEKDNDKPKNRDNVTIIDLGSLSVLKTMQAGKKPVHVAVNPSTHEAAIANEDSDDITIIDLNTLATKTAITVAKHPKALAYNDCLNMLTIVGGEDKSWMQVVEVETAAVRATYSFKEVEDVRVHPLMNKAFLAGKEGLTVVDLPNPVPTLLSLTPEKAVRGDKQVSISISGRGFTEATEVYLNNIRIPSTYPGCGIIDAAIPEAYLQTVGNIEIKTSNPAPDGGASNILLLHIENPPPQITVLDPAEAMAGTSSLMTAVLGRGFFNDTLFYLNGSQKAFTYGSDQKAYLDLSASDMEYGRYLDISAFNMPPGGGYSNTAKFTVLNPIPTLSSVHPAEILIDTNTNLTLSGAGFVKTADVQFNGNSIPFTYVGQNNLQVTIPESLLTKAGVFAVKVTNPAPGGGTSGVANFTIKNPVPVLTGIDPNKGLPNAAMIINLVGSGFTADSAVSIDGNNIAAMFLDSNHLSITVSAELMTAGSHNIAVSNRAPGGGASSAMALTVVTPGPTIPPDPATVALPLDATVATTMLAASQFLYTGNNPIQTGLAPGTIEAKRAAVLRGRVLQTGGNALSGVRISILRHPEFGSTLSRADGMFDMAVNGGGLLTMIYEMQGYPTVQRQVNVTWQDYAWVSDAVMTPFDTKANPVDLTSVVPIQVAQGNPVTDTDGTRQATLLFSQGTTATMTLPDGSIQPLTSLNVRATEYTVGPNGPNAMPGALPANVAYTYAAEFSVDEAVAASAKNVQFSQPVISYTENFLHFFIGTKVPAGYYDRDRGVWVPSDNGLVIKILSIRNGMADLDVDGSSATATTQVLSALGISNAELRTLAQIYQAGQSLWRVPISHFTPWDYNWPYGPPPDATGPNAPPPVIQPTVTDPCMQSGSIIECQNQTLGEKIDIAGTSFSLNYRSSRIPGRLSSYAMKVHLSGETVPVSLKRIELEISIAGRQFKTSFPPSPNQTYVFTWDGKDCYGRISQGAQPAVSRIGYVYQGVYLTPSETNAIAASASLFGHFSYYGSPATGDKTRQEITLWQEDQITMMSQWNAQGQGVGGWTLNVLHAYDSNGRVLYLGDGRARSAYDLGKTTSTIAGNGSRRGVGGEVPAVDASLGDTVGIATDGAGNIFFADASYGGLVRKVDPQGIMTTVAGNGVRGYSGDGGPATQASLNLANEGHHGVAIDNVGNIYIADGGNGRIRKVDTQGIITTVAGNGQLWSIGGDGGPATQASIGYPRGVATDSAGNFYTTDSWQKIRKVDTQGTITTVAGNGQWGSGGDVVLATKASLIPEGIAVDSAGNIFVSDWEHNSIRKVDTQGIITTVAGNGEYGFGGDGSSATFASLSYPTGVAADRFGNIYIADSGNNRIRKVDTQGIITTVAGDGGWGFGGDGGPAALARISVPCGVAIDGSGNILIADMGNSRIRKLALPLQGFSGQTMMISSENGEELYLFDGYGKHRSTIDAVTSSIIYSFSYDSFGYLAAVTDGYGNVTRIERNASGNATAIVAFGGQRTALSIDANGFLTSITDPVGSTTQFSYVGNGLLASLSDPKGNIHSFDYDEMGYLIKDQDPAGGYKLLSRTETTDGFTVQVSSAMNYVNTYSVEKLTSGEIQMVNTSPSGGQTITIKSGNDTSTSMLPNGTVTSLVRGSDPRLGMMSPIIAGLTITVPSGLQLSLTETRTATLSDPKNVLSLTASTDTYSLNGKAYSSAYDASSKTVTNSTPMGRKRFATLDVKGKIVSRQTLGLLTVSYEYDSKGRLSTITQGTGTQTRVYSIVYDTKNRIAGITDPLSRRITLTYDLAGRITQGTLPDGRMISVGYDVNGNVTSITPPSKPTHRFDYTPVNLMQDYIPPSVETGSVKTTYSYNLDKQLMLVSRPDGTDINVTYDVVGRITSVSYPQATVALSYASTSDYPTIVSRTTATEEAESVAFTYDGFLLTGASWSGVVNGSVAFAYDNDFRVISESVNGGDTVNFTYDNDGVLTGAGSLAINRDASNGLVTGSTLGNVSDAWTYSGFGEPASYSVSHSGSQLLSVQYTRDKIGRITQKSETIGSITNIHAYTYDLAGRLTDVVKNGANIAHYGYDPNGNRLSYTTGATTISGTYDDQDRLLTNGNTIYSYSPNGDLQNKTNPSGTTTYNYDSLGNLVRATLPNGKMIDYVIDGKNRRVGKKINGVLVQGFLYEGQLRPIAEVDGNGNIVSRFVYGTKVNVPDYMIKGGVSYRIIADHLGSPRMVINSNTGVVIQHLDYDEFGNVVNDTNPGFQPFCFAGGLYDRDTNLVKFGLRDYDPATGRWTTKDPILFKGGDTNLFGYTGRDPVNFVDPSGLEPYPDTVTVVTSVGDVLVAFGNLPTNPSSAAKFLTSTIVDKTNAIVALAPDSDAKAYAGTVLSAVGVGVAVFGDSYLSAFLSGYGLGTAIYYLPVEGLNTTVGDWWTDKLYNAFYPKTCSGTR